LMVAGVCAGRSLQSASAGEAESAELGGSSSRAFSARSSREQQWRQDRGRGSSGGGAGSAGSSGFRGVPAFEHPGFRGMRAPLGKQRRQWEWRPSAEPPQQQQQQLEPHFSSQDVRAEVREPQAPQPPPQQQWQQLQSEGGSSSPRVRQGFELLASSGSLSPRPMQCGGALSGHLPVNSGHVAAAAARTAGSAGAASGQALRLPQISPRQARPASPTGRQQQQQRLHLPSLVNGAPGAGPVSAGNTGYAAAPSAGGIAANGNSNLGRKGLTVVDLAPTPVGPMGAVPWQQQQQRRGRARWFGGGAPAAGAAAAVAGRPRRVLPVCASSTGSNRAKSAGSGVPSPGRLGAGTQGASGAQPSSKEGLRRQGPAAAVGSGSRVVKGASILTGVQPAHGRAL
jgi:hypothetical protein